MLITMNSKHFEIKEKLIINDAVQQFIEYLNDNFETLTVNQVKDIVDNLKDELEATYLED